MASNFFLHIRLGPQLHQVTFLVVCLLAQSSFALAPENTPADELPRYQFTIGQELVYEQNTEEDLLLKPVAEEDETHRYERHNKWWVWVHKRNYDGSWRLLIRKQIKNLSIPRRGNPMTSFENDFLGYCDLQPDGSFEPNPTLGRNADFKTQPDELFVRLPVDAVKLRDGWQYASPIDDARQSFRFTKREGDLLQFAGPLVRPEDPNFQLHTLRQIEFDFRRGLVMRLINEFKSDWPWHARRTVVLASAEQRETGWITSLATEANRYFAARKESEKLLKKASRTRTKADAEAAIEQGREILVSLKAASSLAELKQLADASLKMFERDAEGEVKDAATREELYAKPPLDWETSDFNGQTHRLVDYRGKVVLLDFWYRRCGPCIKALPTVKKLAAKYEGKGVVVLGINSDENDDDAKSVIDSFKLRHTNLRAGKIPELYGVQGWPTFIVLDHTGRIAEYHVGSTDDLYAYVTRTVDELLTHPRSAE